MKTLDELVSALNQRLVADEAAEGSVVAPHGPAAAQVSPPEPLVVRLEDLMAAASPRAFVLRAFRAVLRRDPDDAALAHYAEAIAHGRQGREDLVRGLLASAEGRRAGCAVVGISPQEDVTGALAGECLRLSHALARAEAQIAALQARLQRIPRAQEYLLRAVEDYLRDCAERLRQEAAAPARQGPQQ